MFFRANISPYSGRNSFMGCKVVPVLLAFLLARAQPDGRLPSGSSIDKT
jgi:hypothetical protein